MRFSFFATNCVACALMLATAAYADTAGLVRGTVTDNGKPVGNAAVELHGESVTTTTITKADGTFIFPRVTFGTYTIRAQGPDHRTASTTIDVADNAVLIIALTLAPLREIEHTGVTVSTGAAGTPISVNTINRRQINALPVVDSLNSLITTLPGIVPFSYGEPIAHGFHGITYEIDGAPLPQSTSSNFAEIVDPHNVDSMEVFTGSIPAEFGGNRMGAVVNILTDRSVDLSKPSEGSLSIAAGSYGTKQTNLSEALKLGASRLFLNANLERSDRGLDSPTFVPEHDNANQGDQFLRYLTPMGTRGTLAVDLSNQQSTFQIPTNTTFNPNDPVLNAPGTDDVQREEKRFANIVFTENTPDQRGFFQIIPWVSYDRIAYDGDLAEDTRGIFMDQSGSTCAAAQEPNCPLDGLRQDRRSSYGGIRTAYFHSSDHHALKFGVEGTYEDFSGETLLTQAGQPNFNDNVSKRGTQFGAWAQDKWSPSKAVTVNLGLRYDRSDGFTSGNQLSPRIEVNLAPDAKNVVHFYYGRFYAAPFLEDTRCDAVVTSGAPPDCGAANLPAYDLQPERDSYYEGGVSHTFTRNLTGSFTYWARNVSNVLDTTQIFPTPIFAVFNNTIGQAEGTEIRVEDALPSGDSLFFSGSVSRSSACGISGSTFLFPPDQLGCFPDGLQPEDHDQTYAINSAYTHRFGARKLNFATLQAVYGSGYPVQFQNGSGRLPSHLTFNASLGRDAKRGTEKSLGYDLTLENITGRAYLLKVNNGFNTTQWAPGFKALFRVTAPL